MRTLPATALTAPVQLDDDLLVHGDNADVLGRLPDGAFDLIYLDPPFNTGREQARSTMRMRADPQGTRTGFGGRRYATDEVVRRAFADTFDDYLAFLGPRLERCRDLLADHGTLYLHLDPRESHYAKVLLDEIFGRQCFLNELVWAYDFGARTTRRWPAKHDTILVYVRDPARYWFDSAEVDREPYMAPGLQTAERAARGKLPTDVWWHTIVGTTSHERTGYPTQKPEGVLRRIVTASSRPGGWCLDPFCGSGTLGAVAAGLGRRFVLIDAAADAVEITEQRLGGTGTLPSDPLSDRVVS